MRTSTLTIRGLKTRITEWGEEGNPKLVLLHGWMDCGGSFQFIALYLDKDFHLIAPDLRGFGDTDHAPGYWFPDYFADLEALLDIVTPNQPVNLAGHSMGGNIAMMYAGIRHERVARVMSLESVGLMPTQPSEAPAKYRKWLMEILANEQPRVYPSRESLLMSMHRANPQLQPEMIEALADLWAEPVEASGGYRLKHDHAHRHTNPYRYNYDDTKAIWSEITAPVGLAMATASPMYQRIGMSGRIDEVRDLLKITDERYFVVEGAGHMLHLERPEETAQLLRKFFI